MRSYLLIILIISYIVILIISFFGFCGAIRESYWMSMTVSIILFCSFYKGWLKIMRTESFSYIWECIFGRILWAFGNSITRTKEVSTKYKFKQNSLSKSFPVYGLWFVSLINEKAFTVCDKCTQITCFLLVCVVCKSFPIFLSFYKIKRVCFSDCMMF